ncbi:MAG: hypothetical protein ABI224_11510 [Acetobacteraceae bacterium]
MPMERVAVGNFENWGKLVKTWATGDDYVRDGYTYAVPTTLHEFKMQVARAKTGLNVPSRITSLSMIPGDHSTLVIRLPPGEMIKDTEVRLQALGQAKGGSVYPLPDFYGDGWVGLSMDELMVFHAERIGEYTINNCA